MGRGSLDKTFVRFAVVLGVLSAVGPLAIDMYLPALPAIARDLGTDQNHVGMTLMGFFLGLTIGQPVYGPVSDRCGRRAPLAIGLILYVFASVVCAMAANIDVLIAGRVLQGLGAGTGLAISAAIVRDLHTGPEAVRLMAARTLVIGISPILAPIAGAAIIATSPWRNIFTVAAAFGLLALGLVALIPETHPPANRAKASLREVVGVYAALSGHGRFRNVVLSASLVQVALIAYIAGSPFVLLTIDHVSPVLYSAIFAGNACGFIIAAQITPQLMRWVGPAGLIRWAILIQTLASITMVVEAVLGRVGLPYILPALFVFQSCTGAVGTPATVLALQDHGSVAGTASALMMCLMVGFGSLGSFLVAVLANGTGLPMTGAMALASVAALFVAWTIGDDSTTAFLEPAETEDLLH
jgi:DHA1 family bicyclomycin/chloramphenicol resistance-like MFS transporter